jgi:hypothetical protein
MKWWDELSLWGSIAIYKDPRLEVTNPYSTYA